MSRNIAFPMFPSPPREYNPQYLSDMLRAFFLYQQQIQNAGQGRNTFTVFTNLKSDDQGLETGAVFRDGNGFLKVTMANRPNLAGLSASAMVGSVTVTV